MTPMRRPRQTHQVGAMTKRIDYTYFCLGFAAGIVLVAEAHRALGR
jgi:hypothetical protein